MNQATEQTENDKYSVQNLFEVLNTQKDSILRVAKQATGLNFKYVSITQGKSGIAISCDGTDDDLGFYGHYISEVSYTLRIGAEPTLENKGNLWASSGIAYKHKTGGTNGVSDSEVLIFYNWHTKQFVVKEESNQ